MCGWSQFYGLDLYIHVGLREVLSAYHSLTQRRKLAKFICAYLSHFLHATYLQTAFEVAGASQDSICDEIRAIALPDVEKGTFEACPDARISNTERYVYCCTYVIYGAPSVTLVIPYKITSFCHRIHSKSFFVTKITVKQFLLIENRLKIFIL